MRGGDRGRADADGNAPTARNHTTTQNGASMRAAREKIRVARTLANLCNLCSYHHHLVHDGDYRVERLATGKFRFKNPRGWVIPEVPSPAKPSDKPLAELELEGWEGKPKWGYEPIDLPLVIESMWRPGMPSG